MKANLKKSLASALFLLTLVSIMPSGAFADGAKKPRYNDTSAQRYILSHGILSREINGLNCVISNSVSDFKVSTHPLDSALVYFERINAFGRPDLYEFHGNSPKELAISARTRNCPSANTEVAMRDMAKYTVVSNPVPRNKGELLVFSQANIVNMALDYQGNLKAWGTTGNAPVFALADILDYRMNLNYGHKGAQYSSYVAFAISKSGYVVKIDGIHPEKSKLDISRRHQNIDQFLLLK